MKAVVFEHCLEKFDTLVAVEAYLAEVAHVALEHIVEYACILGSECKAGQQGMGCEVTIANVEPRSVAILVVGREAEGAAEVCQEP